MTAQGPLTNWPDWRQREPGTLAHYASPDAGRLLGLLPVSALSDGLRDVLQHGAGMPWGDLGILAVWAVAGLAAAGRWFRWE